MAEPVKLPIDRTLWHPRRKEPSSLFHLISKQEQWKVALHLSLQVVYWGSIRPRLNWTLLRSLIWTAPPLIAHLLWIGYRVGQERLFEEQLRGQSERLAKIISGPDRERVAELLSGAELLTDEQLVQIEGTFQIFVTQEREERKKEGRKEWLRKCIEGLKETPPAACQQLIGRLDHEDLDQIEREYDQLVAIQGLLLELEAIPYTSRLIERLKERAANYRQTGHLFNVDWFRDGVLFAPKSCLHPDDPIVLKLLSGEPASPQERLSYQTQWRRREEITIQLNRIPANRLQALLQNKDLDEIEREYQWMIHIQRALDQFVQIFYTSPLVIKLREHAINYCRGEEFKLYWFQQGLSFAPKSYFYPDHPAVLKLATGEPLSWEELALYASEEQRREDLRSWASRLDQILPAAREELSGEGDLDALEERYQLLFLIQKALTNLNTIQYTSSLVERLKAHRAAYYEGGSFNLDWFQDSLLFASTSYYYPQTPIVVRLLDGGTLTLEERFYYKRQATTLL